MEQTLTNSRFIFRFAQQGGKVHIMVSAVYWFYPPGVKDIPGKFQVRFIQAVYPHVPNRFHQSIAALFDNSQLHTDNGIKKSAPI